MTGVSEAFILVISVQPYGVLALGARGKIAIDQKYVSYNIPYVNGIQRVTNIYLLFSWKLWSSETLR